MVRSLGRPRTQGNSVERKENSWRGKQKPRALPKNQRT
nr:MAG TPA: hypothetical protein [Caudoviricetes sp.]DAN84184.1 MAG TPA: hypothetical protein [Caudoviricetes sp.]